MRVHDIEEFDEFRFIRWDAESSPGLRTELETQ